MRPLLDVPREALVAYAVAEGLSWQEDPSNQDRRFDRNFLRHDILPRLADRWPAATSRLARSAALAAETQPPCSRQLAAIDLAESGRADRLSIAAFNRLSPARQRNLLRHAVRQAGLPALPAARLEKILDDLLPARADAQPLVAWPGAEARRFRERLYLLRELAGYWPGVPADAGMVRRSNWAPGSAACDSRPGKRGPGSIRRLPKPGSRVTWRQGGERIRCCESDDHSRTTEVAVSGGGHRALDANAHCRSVRARSPGGCRGPMDQRRRQRPNRVMSSAGRIIRSLR